MAKESKKPGKELSVSEWQDEIDRGLEFRRAYGKEASWARLEKLFYNRDDSQAHAAANLIMASGDTLLSQLSVPFPGVSVKSRTRDGIAGARIQEQLNNTFIQTLGIRQEVEQSVLNAFLWGRGIIKIGYDSEFGWNPDYDFGLLHDSRLGVSQTQHAANGRRIEYMQSVKPGMPWVAAVLPHDFVVPTGTREISDATWVAHRVIRHIDDLKDDVKYSVKGLKGSMSKLDVVKSYEQAKRPYGFGMTMKTVTGLTQHESDYVELWEIHDRKTGKIYAIATQHDKFLRNEHDALQLDGRLPFTSINFVPRARTFWVTSDADYLIQSQAELADIALQGQKHRRARVLKIVAEKGLFSAEEMASFTSEEVGVVALAEPSQADGEKSIAERLHVVSIPMDQGLGLEAQQVRRDSREMIGLSSNQLGEFDQSSRRSASEAMIVQQASGLRMDRRQAVIANVYKNIFEILNPICWEYWETPQLVEILGPSGEAIPAMILGDSIKGEYKYEVSFTTNPPETLQQRRQNALQMYLMLSQNPFIDPVGLVKNLVFAFNDQEFASMFRQDVLNGQTTPGLAGPGGASAPGNQASGQQGPPMGANIGQQVAAGQQGGLQSAAGG